MIKTNGALISKYLSEDPQAVYPPESLEVAKLTDWQQDQLDKMRKQIRNLCHAEQYEQAERVAKLALALISEGPPSIG